MSKKQVLLLSLVVALPAVGLLVALVFGALENGGNMFSGMMTVVVAIAGLLVLALGASPLAIMAFYPADGFASMAPPEAAETDAPPAPRPSTDDDEDLDDEYEADGFDDGGTDEDGEELFDDDGEFEDLDDEDEWE